MKIPYLCVLCVLYRFAVYNGAYWQFQKNVAFFCLFCPRCANISDEFPHQDAKGWYKFA